MKNNSINLSLVDFLSENESKSMSIFNIDSSAYLSFFCWNIGNPSLKRASKQATWLRNQSADIIILTECKLSEGCLFLEKYFQAFDYHVVFPKPNNNEYGVMIISKYQLGISKFSNHIEDLSTRVVSVKLPSIFDEIEVIGVYVPSRDTSYEKINKKRLFLEILTNTLGKSNYFPRIFCGDFNILEPDHIPRYPIFKDWEYNFYTSLFKYKLKDAFRHLNLNVLEYSWVGRTGDGYRYDHFFVSLDILHSVHKCFYYHEPRELKLSDHSAIICILQCENK